MTSGPINLIAFAPLELKPEGRQFIAEKPFSASIGFDRAAMIRLSACTKTPFYYYYY